MPCGDRGAARRRERMRPAPSGLWVAEFQPRCRSALRARRQLAVPRCVMSETLTTHTDSERIRQADLAGTFPVTPARGSALRGPRTGSGRCLRFHGSRPSPGRQGKARSAWLHCAIRFRDTALTSADQPGLLRRRSPPHEEPEPSTAITAEPAVSPIGAAAARAAPGIALRTGVRSQPQV
jgi:hypothetical protein